MANGAAAVQMQQTEQILVTVFICVIGALLLLVGLGIYFENELTNLFFGSDATAGGKPASGGADTRNRRESAPTGTPGGGSAEPAADPGTGFGGWGANKRPGERRVYSSGVRLDELLKWPAVDACRALHAYTLDMSGDDTEAYFSALPQITNAVLGLDHAKGALQKGWMNLQALFLIEPHRNPRLAQQLHGALLELLSALPVPPAPPAGGLMSAAALSSATAKGRPAQPGSLFTQLMGGRMSVRYNFFAKQLPRPTLGPLSPAQPHLIEQLATQPQHAIHAHAPPAAPYGVAAPAAYAGSPLAAGAAPAEAQLVLTAWEYLLFCFLLWPLGGDVDEGGALLESVPQPAPASAAAASLPFGMAGGPPPLLYHQLLQSFLDVFVPVPKKGAAAVAPPSQQQPAAYDPKKGDLLLHAICQFWLGQNPAPHQEPYMQVTFVPTSAAVLGCLHKVVRHLNAHEAALLEDAALAAHVQSAHASSPHALLQKPFYDFFATQLRFLPETSARVNTLIRLTVLYLHPWALQTSAHPPKGAGAGAAADTPGLAPSCRDGAGAAWDGSRSSASAERWAWAGFVKRNFPMYLRLIGSVAQEVQNSRFDLSSKKEMSMLHLVFGVFLQSPHVLPLLRSMCEAAADLKEGRDWQSSADCTQLREQLYRLEVSDQAAHEACKKLTLRSLYDELDKLGTWLGARLVDLRKKQQAGGFASLIFDEGGGSSGLLPQLEKLIDANERIMKALRPPRLPEKKAHQQSAAPAAKLLPLSPRPLDRAGRAEVLQGARRCSALRVPYRATPSLPVRPVSQGELRMLVEWAEALAAHLPPRLTAPPPGGLGVHPRLLASLPGLGLWLLSPASLLAVRGRIAAAPLAAAWWLLLACNAALSWIFAARWWQRHSPSHAAACESWVPWISEQFACGATEAELRAYLEATLPTNSQPGGATSIDEMLERARRKLR